MNHQPNKRKMVRQLQSRITPLHLYVISFMHMAKNHCKSVPAQIIPSSHSSLHGSSIGSTKRGSLMTAPSNYPQLPFPLHPQPSVSQPVAQIGSTKFLHQNCPFRLLLNFLSPNSHVSAYFSLPNSALNSYFRKKNLKK